MITLRRYSTLATAALAGCAFVAAAAAQSAPPAAHKAAPAAAKSASAGKAEAAKSASAAPAPKFPVTLVKPVGPTKAPRLAGGWIQRWLVLDPISSSGLTQKVVQEEVKKEYFPGQFTTIPKDGDKVTAAHQPLPAAPGAARGTPPQYGDVELTWHAEDTLDYNLNLYHLFFPLKKPTTNVIFYVVTLIDCPQDIPNVRLAIGSNAASVWWLNGEELIGLYNDRQTVQDDGVSKRITLRKGQNILRAAIVNAGGATDFCARFLDEHDKPLHGYTITLNPEK